MPATSFPMPFPTVKATFYPPSYGVADDYGNPAVSFDPLDKVETLACYSPANTADEFADGRPHAAELSLTLYLPKSFSADIRGAKVELETGDPVIDALSFMVEGVPISYDRAATPGDYSWAVQVVEYVG